MKRIFAIVAVLATAAVIYSAIAWTNRESKDGIHFFNGSWEQALQKARKEQKPIFMDIYATWCGPCKMLKRQTFTSKEAGDYFNANYVNLSFDGESGEGVTLAEKFNISAYPTLIILDKNGSLVHMQAGFLQAADLVALGKQYYRK